MEVFFRGRGNTDFYEKSGSIDAEIADYLKRSYWGVVSVKVCPEVPRDWCML